MKRNLTLITCLLLLLGVGSAHAYTAPEAGKVYRIYNSKSNKVIVEDCIAREVVSVDAVADDFKQLWVLQTSGTGFLVQNAYSGQYLQPCRHLFSILFQVPFFSFCIVVFGKEGKC